MSRGVCDDSVLEELLACLLHFHDNVVIVLAGAEHIEHQAFVGVVQPQLLCGQVGDVANGADIRGEDGVQEMYKVLKQRPHQRGRVLRQNNSY